MTDERLDQLTLGYISQERTFPQKTSFKPGIAPDTVALLFGQDYVQRSYAHARIRLMNN